MIKTERDYRKAMQQMVKDVIKGKNPLPQNPTREDLEILTACVERGYLFADGNKTDRKVVRTMDGCPRVFVDTKAVPFDGYLFIAPDRAERRSKAALSISIVAVVFSGLAFLVSLLSNIDKIINNLDLVLPFLGGF